MSGTKRSDWIYDELLCFLGSAFFQVPVTSFIEANCLIFDPSVEDSQEYKKIHKDYKKVVETLLDAFTKDSSLSHDEVIKALTDMNSKQDLREIFQGLFEQVLAMDDFTIFVPMMVQKNIELQQQALMLIIQTTGSLPDSLRDGEAKLSQEPDRGQPVDDEEEIMKKVLAQSQREYDKEQKRKTQAEKKDDKLLKSTIALSQAEVEQLEKEKQSEQEKLNVAMATLMTQQSNTSLKNIPTIQPKVIPEQKPKIMPQQKPVVKDNKVAMSDLVTHESHLSSLKDLPTIHPKIIPAQIPSVSPAQKPIVKESHVSVVVTPDPIQTRVGAGLQPKSKLPDISSSEAAANWLKSAQTESSGGGEASSAVKRAAAALQGLSPEELKKRQEYLRQQRDKLVEMKRKEREKQLLTAEQSNPQRPMSARAARQTMDGKSDDEKKVSPEEQKKLEMRRAIANKLKAELMGAK